MKKKYKESNLGIKAIGLIEAAIVSIVTMSFIATPNSLEINSYAILISCYVASFIAIGISIGLYDSGSRESIRSIVKRTAFTHICSAMIILTISFAAEYNHISLLSILLSSFVSISLISYLRAKVMNSRIQGLGKKKTLILGAGNRATFIQDRMRRGIDKVGIDIVGYLPVKGDDRKNVIDNNKKVTLENSLLNYALENNLSQIVIAVDNKHSKEHLEELAACKLQGISIVPLYEFIEAQIGAIPVDMLCPRELIYSTGFENKHKFYQLFSWVINISLSTILVLLTWPIMLVTALLIKLEDGWHNPVLYKQIRIGENGKEFEIIKFRSMITDAEKNGAMMATKNDARTTKVGEKIRKYRIDELPQVINVLRGEMAFVGPRPERPVFVENLTNKFPYYHERHNIKPGLTGWAQLKYPYGENERDSLEKLRFDMYYVKHQSLLLDILIIMRTVEIVLFGKGR